jgi:hypothetical protein
MPDILWLAIGIVLAATLLGLVAGSRSRSTGAATGFGIGAFLGVLAAFPLLAIGLSTI